MGGGEAIFTLNFCYLKSSFITESYEKTLAVKIILAVGKIHLVNTSSLSFLLYQCF